MALETYKQKRNFRQTPEPAGKKNAATHELKFVIQRHAASHLHYDFRLEMEGVLKSWAVPKGPSLNPQDKRLAMMVEDHPFEYRTFHGIIPEGNYGAGIVEIWDEGTYHAIESEDRKESEKIMLRDLKKGSIKFVLHGKKLKGEFALVKIKNNNSAKDNAWLLIKHKDEYATDEAYNSEDHVPANSKIVKKEVASKKASKTSKTAIKKVAAKVTSKSEKEIPSKKKEQPVQSKVKQGKDAMPHEVKPMLAKLKDGPFDSSEWIFEIKWDGYRAIAEIDNGEVNLYSRNLISFNHKYKPIVESLELLGHNAVLDGEIVVLNPDGTSSFQMLQQYDEKPSPDLYYVVFDLLFLDGYDLRDLPLTERKEKLKNILPDIGNLKYSDHIHEEGIVFFAAAKKNKLEGIMAKKADGAYRIGSRSDQWLKIKIISAQEAIICGFTAPRNSRKNFGALILGAYEKGRLVYIGHTGGGFTETLLASTLKLMKPLIQEASPFDVKIKTNEKVTWVKPQLVCEIAFSEWTNDGHMRQPIFQGMRIDKKAKEVVRELPAVTNVPEDDMETKVKSKKTTPAKSSVKKTVNKLVDKKETGKKNDEHLNTEIEINKHVLKITNRSKVYWPVEGYTKGDLIDYYMQISEYILPYLKDRPESLNRHPNGINGSSFYQKDMSDSFPDWIEYKEIFSESNGKDIRYMMCQNKATLIYMANLGCIEMNPWNSRIQKIKNPDYIVIDLDPSDNNTFEEVIQTALIVKKILDKAGAESYCKTSGATGLHIYIPLGAKYDYEQGKNFAHIIAQLAHDQLPELTSLVRSPKERKKQIYIDYLQNRGGQTLAAPYSVRPKPGATVSTPLEWTEVKKGLHPSAFTIKTIFKRLEKKGDLFKGVLGKGIDMEKCLKKLGE